MSGAEERKASASRLYDEIAAEYDQVGPPFFASRGVELVAAVGVGAGWRVLDAGCGRGACLFPAASAVGVAGSVVGIDVSAGMVAETWADVRRRGLTNVAVEVGDAEEPAFEDGSFDAVLSGFVLRQLPGPAAALRSYHRVLRPGGRLGVSYYASGFAGEWEAVADALEPFVASQPDAHSPQTTPTAEQSSAAPRTDDPRTDESRADESRADESRADESRAAAPRNAELRVDESRTDESRAAEPQADEPRNAELQTAEPRAAGLGADGLDSVGGLSELLRLAGFGPADVIDESHEIEVADVDRWWEYLWHSGYRGTMNRILVGRVDDAREAATAAARSLAEPDGRVLMRVVVRRALATRPPSEAE